MKLTENNLYREDLQPYYFRFRLLVKMLHHRFGVWFVNFVLGFTKGSRIKGLTCEQHWIPSSSGGRHQIRIRIYRPATVSQPLPAMLYAHGGGFELGVPEQVNKFYAALISTRPIIIVAPDYRKSVKHPYPAGFNDCYDTLLWMRDHMEELGISTDRFVVAGHSAGGGLAAALAIKARDTGEVKIAFQMPVYPMLDYRQDTESCRRAEKAPLWDAPANRLAWKFYLRDLTDQGLPVPVYASPALNQDFNKLPPAISFVGSLEPFTDETIQYMDALKQAGVELRFKVFDRAFHAAEVYSVGSAYEQEANEFQLGAFGEFYDFFYI